MLPIVECCLSSRLDTVDGIRIDVIFALLPFGLDAIGRAEGVTIAGRLVRVVTAENLVLMKIISERERDVGDAEGIVKRRGPALDRGYLDPRIHELADALERPEISGTVAALGVRLTSDGDAVRRALRGNPRRAVLPLPRGALAAAPFRVVNQHCAGPCARASGAP